MRISDWSSDVCSSDLLPSRLAHALRARHAVTGRAQSVEHVIDGIAHALRHQPAHDLGDTGAESDAAPFGIALYRIGALVVRRHVLEIGRASCRERVCQYV